MENLCIKRTDHDIKGGLMYTSDVRNALEIYPATKGGININTAYYISIKENSESIQ